MIVHPNTYQVMHPLGPSGTGLLTIPKPRTKRHGEAAFSYYAHSLWNNLPENTRGAQTVDIFKRNLKTYLFSLDFLYGAL